LSKSEPLTIHGQLKAFLSAVVAEPKSLAKADRFPSVVSSGLAKKAKVPGPSVSSRFFLCVFALFPTGLFEQR